MKKTAVCIISGGMDSALAAKIAQKESYEIIALHFNYGQRTETKELACFRKIANNVNASEVYEVDLPFFEQIGASALTDKSIEVPTGGLEDGVPVTYVPFRNGIFPIYRSIRGRKTCCGGTVYWCGGRGQFRVSRL